MEKIDASLDDTNNAVEEPLFEPRIKPTVSQCTLYLDVPFVIELNSTSQGKQRESNQLTDHCLFKCSYDSKSLATFSDTQNLSSKLIHRLAGKTCTYKRVGHYFLFDLSISN